jgi:hypothetical protein
MPRLLTAALSQRVLHTEPRMYIRGFFPDAL